MVEDANSMFEWCVANRLNKIEWLLLGNYKWGDELHTRHKRLAVLTALGHEYSLLVGCDIPLGNVQQHAWSMVNTRLPFALQVRQIHERVDWVFSAGFDFLTTESGLSEFTHPECSLMLDLLNAFSGYVNGTWGREGGVKVHCSTGQTCEGFIDPLTAEPVGRCVYICVYLYIHIHTYICCALVCIIYVYAYVYVFIKCVLHVLPS